MVDPLDLTLQRRGVAYRQIGEQIRDRIRNGRLPPGTKLPSSADLAAKWHTHVATIHAALTPLVKEGLLTRQPKIGTFVSPRRARLSEVGIYYDSNIWQNTANAFKRAVHVELVRLMEAQKIAGRVWFDPRSGRQRAKPWSELTRAVEQREVQAVIATDVPAAEIAWLQTLPVLTAFFTYAPVRNRVLLDFDQFAEVSVGLLKKQGCRSAGVISILEPGQPSLAKPAASRDFYAHFSALCRAQGIEVRESWIRTAPGFVRDESQEEFGYREFRAIWRQARRPEGLVVFPDTSVPGVILAVLEQRADVPGRLKLVAHKHAEINFLCPLPITFLPSSTARIARALFAQIETQFAGGTCEPIVVPFEAPVRLAGNR